MCSSAPEAFVSIRDRCLLTQEIHVVGGRAAIAEIRQRLFEFSEVLEVLATSRPDALVVVYVGRPLMRNGVSASAPAAMSCCA
jgi:hypothetical protein